MTEMAGVVLVVGSDPDRMSAVVGPLREAGFRVGTADDGAAALDLIEAEEFDVLLFDDGDIPATRIDFVRRLVDIPGRPTVILVATVDDMSYHLSALSGRKVDYLIRPFEREDLLARVTVAARARREGTSGPPSAEVDPLTGLGNRAYFEDALAREMAIATRYRRALGLVLVDADDLAAVNAAHGREVGDECLRAIARAIVSTVRKADRVARVGGDEFAILLPETHRSSLESFVDRLLVWAGSERYRAGERLVTPALSIGSCVYPDEALESKSLRRSAERDLHRLKRMRTTKIRTFRPGSEEGPPS